MLNLLTVLAGKLQEHQSYSQSETAFCTWSHENEPQTLFADALTLRPRLRPLADFTDPKAFVLNRMPTLDITTTAVTCSKGVLQWRRI